MNWTETRARLIELGIAATRLPVEWQPDIDLSGAYLRRADLDGTYLRWADLSGADLYGADLSGADLRGADLSGADLRRADLRGADLRRADLSGADLSGADLRRADLYGADLSDIIMNWRSHDLIAEILRQAAADDWEKRQVAGLILISRDWCWSDFLRLHHPLQGWAMDVLRQWQHCPEEGAE